MVEVEEALEIIYQEAVKSRKISMKVSSRICGFVLSHNIKAHLSLPYFPQSSMDGYAIKLHNSHIYKVVGEVAAGSSNKYFLKPGEAVRIFTGAKVPESSDSVVIQEKVTRKENLIFLDEEPIHGQNIRPIGSQIKKNDLVLKKGHTLNPASLGILQSLGINSVEVFDKPSISIVLTGSELVRSEEKLTDGKIYESNSVVLESVLNNHGIRDISIVYSQDSLEETQKKIKTALSKDIVLISGGISVGDYDFVHKSLINLGVNEGFYRVRQKPGKPLFFGTKGKTKIFALPGNPASTLNCFYVYVLPIIYKFLGKNIEDLLISQTTLLSDIVNNFGRALFLKAISKDLKTSIIDENNSATLLSFSRANALVYIPSSVKEIKKGSKVKTWFIH